MAADRRRIAFRVEGRVQGVGFRAAARLQAVQLGLVGHVRNCPDGAVEGEAEGGGDGIDSFLEWLRRGPAWARVDTLIRAETPLRPSENEFVVRRSRE